MGAVLTNKGVVPMAKFCFDARVAATLRAVALAVCVVVLGACAAASTDSTPISPVTAPAQPTPILTGVCTTLSELESWAQDAQFFRDEFILTLNLLKDLRRAEMANDFARLIELRDGLAALPAPDCAQDAHLIMLTAMNSAIGSYQTYINGASEDVNSAITQVRTELDTAQAILQTLIERLSQQQLQTLMPPQSTGATATP
jgi:uncharacterized coiled-coil protein SlyX